MNLYRQIMDRFFPPIQTIPAGMYHYMAPADAPFPYRLHMRIEPDGSGILIVNASTVVHLNPTAAEYAYHLVQQTPEAQAVAEISKRYNAPKDTIQKDFHNLLEQLKTLVEMPDLDPVAFLDFERDEPYTCTRIAPYRIDCALTYKLTTEGIQHYAPSDRVSRELSDEEWKDCLQKAWNAGIPHVIFTGGEPTLRTDLPELVLYAEQLGMVTGLITEGLRFVEPGYLEQLLQAGLDHVMILLDPQDEQCWEAVRLTLAEDIHLTTHLTLSEQVLPNFDAILDRLIGMGCDTLSLSAETIDLGDELRAKRETLAERQLHLIWDQPVPYSQFNPVAVELADDTPDNEVVSNGPGNGWLYIEPDGDVLPGQGYYQQVLGNLLNDPWEKIWANANPTDSPSDV